VGHQTDWHLCDAAADRAAPTPSAAAEAAVPEVTVLLRRLKNAEDQLHRAVRDHVGWRRDRLAGLRLRHPREQLVAHRRTTEALETRLASAMRLTLERRRSRLGLCAGKLDAISPLRVLERGYAIATHQGKAVMRAEDVVPGDRLSLRLHEGERVVEVLE
jgi:exodeoxyribonuclease VII large subunit